MSATAPLHLVLPNRREAIETARLAVSQYLAAHHPSAALTFQVELVLEESLMNIIWHAYGDSGEHQIDLEIEVLGGEVQLHFADTGVAFDPTQAVAPQLPTTLSEATPGGLGLMLVRKFAKWVSYERKEGRNHLGIGLVMMPA